MKKILFRAKGYFTKKWIISQDVYELGVQAMGSDTLCEFVYTTNKGKDLFTGDVLFEEIEHDEGDTRIFFVLVWLPERLRYSLLEMGEYLAYTKGQGSLDEGEYYETKPEELDKLHYKGTIYDEDFDNWISGSV